MTLPKSLFYNYDKLWSYNALINFIVAERGVGKTYGAIKSGINDFLKNGRQFVYLRRTKVELEESLPKLFDAIIANDEFPDHTFHVEGTTLFCDDQIIGYGMALSTARNLKSNTFTNVYTIIFDEFIIESSASHYLKKEVNCFFNLIETVMRLRDFRAVLLGNAVSVSNPYFDEFGIDKPYGSQYKLYRGGLILVNYAKNKAYQDYKKTTRFGRLIEGTSYGNYAIQNEFLNDDSHFIEKKTGNCKHWSVLIINSMKIGTWINYKTKLVYLSKDYDPKNPCTVALDLMDHSESTLLAVGRNNQWIRPVVEALKRGDLRFENQKIKNATVKILERMI